MDNNEKFVSAFCDALNIGPEKICDSMSYGDPSWDSIAHMAVVVALETAFDIMIETEDVIDMSSVGKAREILEKYGINIRS